MTSLLMLGLVGFVIGSLIALLIVFLMWWIKLRKIKKEMPKDFQGKPEDWKEINYDADTIERRKIQYGEGKGKQEGDSGRFESEAGGFGTGKKRSLGEGEIGNEEDEIRRLREEITRRESELGR